MRTNRIFLFFWAAAAAHACALPSGAILRIALAPKMPPSLKPGRTVEGTIGQPLYDGACRVLPAGVKVKATSDGGAVRVDLTGTGEASISVKTTLVRFATERRAAAAGKPGPGVRTMLLRVESGVATSGVEMASLPSGTIPAGTQARVALASGVTSKRSRPGDAVEARLLEPLMSGDKVLVPAGAIVRGALSEAKRARRPYRAGGLRISFQSLQVSGERTVNAPLVVAAGDLSGGARIDKEGGITGSALTKKRALINLGIAYATGKILDDLIEEGAKAALSAAVAGSAETAARYAGLAAGAAVFLMHRGREVKLDPETELVLTFSRAVEITR